MARRLTGLNHRFMSVKIAGRIYAIIGSILLLLVGLGALGTFELRTTAQDLTAYSRIASNSIHIAAIEGDFVNLRRNAIIIATTNDETAAVRAREILNQLRQEIAQVRSGLALDSSRTKLDAIGQAIDGYADNLERSIKLRATREDLVNKAMNSLGPEARMKLSEIVQSAMRDGDFEAAAHGGLAQEELLLVRLNAVRFLDKPEQAIINRVKEEFRDFQQDMVELLNHLENEKRRALAAEVVELGHRYARAFDDMTSAAFALDEMVNVTMTAQAEAIEKQLEEFVAEQRSVLAEIEGLATSNAQKATLIMLVISASAVVLGGFAAILIASGITRPIQGMTEIMSRLAAGDSSVEVLARDRHDEIGAMARAVEVFKQNMVDSERLRAEQADQDRRIEAEKKAAVRAMADEFEAAIGGIVNTVFSASAKMETMAMSLAKNATTTQKLSRTVAAASNQVSNNVHAIAAATEEIAKTTIETSRNAQESTRIARAAVDQAAATSGHMITLSHSAQRAGDIIQIINTVAAQTNLLALNAKIEAAHAGSAGSGFAVVAQEVGALATQTATAAQEIHAHISAILSAAEVAAVATEDIGKTIHRISVTMMTIAAAAEQQSQATQEISQSVHEAAQGTSQVSDKNAEVKNAANQTDSMSGELLPLMQSLSYGSSQLKVEVDKFLAAVQAA